MKTPTRSEFDNLFLAFSPGPDNERMITEVGAMLREAKASERATSTVVGMAPAILKSLTAVGVDCVPFLKVMLMGFWLGVSYAEKHGGGGPDIPDDAIKRMLDQIEQDSRE